LIKTKPLPQKNKLGNYSHTLISSEDIRQFIYCPRIPFFRTVIRFNPIQTPKMNIGRKIHSDVHEFTIPKVSSSDFPDQYLNLYLQAPKLNIHGQVDLIEVIKSPEDLKNIPIFEDYLELVVNQSKGIGCIVEIKTGKALEQVPLHHKAQVVFQALLVESNFNILILAGKIFYSKTENQITFPIWPKDKSWVLDSINKLKSSFNSEVIPSPTIHSGKCTNCEYWKICMRV